MMKTGTVSALLLAAAATTTEAFVAVNALNNIQNMPAIRQQSSPRLSCTRLFSSQPSDSRSMELTLDDLKTDLVRCCTRTSKPLLDEVRGLVRELEEKAEMVSFTSLLYIIIHLMNF